MSTPEPSTSTSHQTKKEGSQHGQSSHAQKTNYEEQADELIRTAEHNKAAMVKPSGNQLPYNNFFSSTAMNDDQFYQLASHTDKRTRRKIQKGKFLDLAKLLKQSKNSSKKDNNLEIVSKDGRSYFLPSAEKDTIEINSFRHWEHAFRIYAGIFAHANHSSADELFQYINNIHEVGVSFVWDNVYEFDIEFRELMAKYPQHNWGVIYHNEWMIKLKGDPKNVISATCLTTTVSLTNRKQGVVEEKKSVGNSTEISAVTGRLADLSIVAQNVVKWATLPRPATRMTKQNLTLRKSK